MIFRLFSQLKSDVPDPPAPWLTDPQLLSPLLDEYDEHLTHLISEITKLKEENHGRKLQFQVYVHNHILVKNHL